MKNWSNPAAGLLQFFQAIFMPPIQLFASVQNSMTNTPLPLIIFHYSLTIQRKRLHPYNDGSRSEWECRRNIYGDVER
jgi:hypothetical protein